MAQACQEDGCSVETVGNLMDQLKSKKQELQVPNSHIGRFVTLLPALCMKAISMGVYAKEMELQRARFTRKDVRVVHSYFCPTVLVQHPASRGSDLLLNIFVMGQTAPERVPTLTLSSISFGWFKLLLLGSACTASNLSWERRAVLYMFAISRLSCTPNFSRSRFGFQNSNRTRMPCAYVRCKYIC